MDRNLIVYQGEVYQVIGQALVKHIDTNGEDYILPMVRIQKVESAFHPKWVNTFWITLASVWAFPSQLDPLTSHWTLGVENGLRDATQNNDD